MKLSKLYANKPDIFEPVNFIAGLNVVMAEIRLPENKNKDTHNLGKTTLGRLLDFCLLSGRDKGFFLFKHSDIFKEFIFFLEIELLDGSFITIQRSVKEATKISFKKSSEGQQDFSLLSDSQWDHFNVPFDRAKNLLDGLLDLDALKPWNFRQSLGYFLRLQNDYQDVFKLAKFVKHVDWKPQLANILGFNGVVIKQHYEKEQAFEDKKKEAKIISKELDGSISDISKITGTLQLKKEEVEKKQSLLDAFDFRMDDQDKTIQLVNEIDEDIALLNMQRYSLNQNKKKIFSSLKEVQILFNPDAASKLFEEAGVFFKDKLRKTFNN
ncbi:hypothetical protein [Thioflexithrix psekupsensis]|uniref:hypothetical protein n=1 Tax=Thioflexithrix psekupsensis TaxID=1570016 RepID=UPI001FD9DA3A|nr:hypothetical protein [Thioflexithrix psekupsensis]